MIIDDDTFVLVTDYNDIFRALNAMAVERVDSGKGLDFGRCRVLRWHERTWRIESPKRKLFGSDAVTTPIQAVARLLFLGGIAPVVDLVVWSTSGERGAIREVTHKGKRIGVRFDGEATGRSYNFRERFNRWAGIGGPGEEWRSIVFLKSEVPAVDRDA